MIDVPCVHFFLLEDILYHALVTENPVELWDLVGVRGVEHAAELRALDHTKVVAVLDLSSLGLSLVKNTLFLR